VRCATDGRDALRIYEEFHPDVVLLDISGFDYHLTKPVDFTSVTELL
jgi:hypothetical protein